MRGERGSQRCLAAELLNGVATATVRILTAISSQAKG